MVLANPVLQAKEDNRIQILAYALTTSSEIRTSIAVTKIRYGKIIDVKRAQWVKDVLIATHANAPMEVM